MFLEKIFDTITINNEMNVNNIDNEKNNIKYNNIDVNITFNELERIVSNVKSDDILSKILNDYNYKETILLSLLMIRKNGILSIPIFQMENHLLTVTGEINSNNKLLTVKIMENKLLPFNKTIIGEVKYLIKINDKKVIYYIINQLIMKNEDINNYNVSFFIDND